MIMSIANEIQRLQTAKADIKAVIESKGWTVPSNATIDQYAGILETKLIDARVVVKYNVTDTSNPTKIGFNQYISGFSAIEIDGVAQPSVVSAYTFSTTGEHTVKYTLTDPTSIGEMAFALCTSLTSIVIPNSVISIGEYAFASCGSLTSCTIGNGVTSIGNNAFNGCTSLPVEGYVRYADICVVEVVDKTQTSYTIKNGTRFIGNKAFNGCSSLTSIVIPDSVTSIGDYAFRYCSGMTSCTIGSGVTSIGDYAFENCSGFTSIVIPDSVTSIGSSAFAFCKSLTKVTVEAATPPTMSSEVFDYTNDCPICVPCESVNTYKAATYWSDYTTRIICVEMIEAKFNVTSTTSPTKILGTTSGFSSIEIDGVEQQSVETEYTFSTTGEHIVKYTLTDPTRIGDNAFTYCENITSITIPSCVSKLYSDIFRSCTSLSSITCNAMTAPANMAQLPSFRGISRNGTLYVPIGSTDYDVWMRTELYWLGYYNWTKVEQ